MSSQGKCGAYIIIQQRAANHYDLQHYACDGFVSSEERCFQARKHFHRGEQALHFVIHHMFN